MSEQEKKILSQELSGEDLAEVSGGWDVYNDDCKNNHNRQMYMKTEFIGEGVSHSVPYFPNCAATVEDGSWCWSNDACLEEAVVYVGMNSCTKAWR